jgi:hypothetical protein
MTVTVQSALSAVQTAAGRLHEAVQELLLIAVEDGPRGTEVHLATIMHDAALDLAAEAEQAWALLQPGRRDDDTQGAVTLRQLLEYQARINALGALLVRELAVPGRLYDLAALGQDHGREAAAWSGEIVRCIETCQYFLWTDVQPTLLGYWQELADMTSRTRTPSSGPTG